MDKITLERISKAHPMIREALLKEYKEINNRLPKNVRLRFTSVLRTPEEQDALFKKRPKVTNARAWQSIHNYGLAFDIVILYDKDNNGTFETAVWNDKDKYWIEVTNYFKSKGWSWGGDWKNFKDSPHFERNFGMNWKQMKAMIDSGKFILEDKVKYIKIEELN